MGGARETGGVKCLPVQLHQRLQDKQTLKEKLAVR